MKDFGCLNKALLSKCSWRFVVQKGAFWNDVIRDKYGEVAGGWCSSEVREGYGVGLWKAIRRWWLLVSNSLFCGWKWEKGEILE